MIDTLGIGGAEQMLVNLLPELAQGGHQVSVAVLRPPLDLASTLRAKGVLVYELPAHGKWNLLAGARNAAHAIRETESDVVHAHLFFSTIYTALARILCLVTARTCVTYHNLAYAPGCNKPGPGLELRKLLNSVSSRYGMDGRIAVSEAVATHYREALNPGEIVVVPNAISVAESNSADKGEVWGRTPAAKDVRVVLPGRLVHEKGHAVLIEALARLASEVDFTAVFAGDGPLRADLERLTAERNLSSRIVLAGKLPHDELLRVVGAADIVVIPSLFEGFGMTAIEAMAASRAVIATRTGGLADIIENGKTGILVDPGNADALAGAIKQLATEPGFRTSLGSAGRAQVIERFNARSVAVQLVSFYTRLMEDTV